VLQGLILQRTRLTEECSTLMMQVVKAVFSDSEDDKRSTLKAYVRALSQPLAAGQQGQGMGLDKRNVIFILEQMCNIIRPPKPERHCSLVLKKVRCVACLCLWLLFVTSPCAAA
jgi:hypothetical protein